MKLGIWGVLGWGAWLGGHVFTTHYVWYAALWQPVLACCDGDSAHYFTVATAFLNEPASPFPGWLVLNGGHIDWCTLRGQEDTKHALVTSKVHPHSYMPVLNTAAEVLLQCTTPKLTHIALEVSLQDLVVGVCLSSRLLRNLQLIGRQTQHPILAHPPLPAPPPAPYTPPRGPHAPATCLSY